MDYTWDAYLKSINKGMLVNSNLREILKDFHLFVTDRQKWKKTSDLRSHFRSE